MTVTETTSPDQEATGPQIELLRMITGHWISQLIYVAAKLGIADLLTDGPKSCDDLAQSTGVHACALYRVMRVLASLGVFTEIDAGQFDLTPIAKCLQTGFPGSRRAMAIVYGQESYRAWGTLLHTVRTGETAFNHLFGKGYFQYLAANPEAAAAFNEFMTELTVHENSAIMATYDFSGIRRLVDVGGGHGALIAMILRAHPEMNGVLFDTASAVEGAQKRIEAIGLADRCDAIAGDFFEAVPEGGNAYVLSRILHDWDDDRAVAILANCRRAMVKDGKILVMEQVIPLGNAPFFGKLRDIHMMVMTGGLERTEAEYRALFAKGGFTLTKVIATQSLMSVVEGVPA